MSATVALSGNDSIIINGRIFSDLGTGDIVTLTFASDIMTVKIPL